MTSTISEVSGPTEQSGEQTPERQVERSVPRQFVSLENDDEWCTAWAASAPLGEGVLLPFGVVDAEAVSPEGAVNMVIALQRVINWAEGQKVRFLSRLQRRPGALPTHCGGGTPREVAEQEVIARGFLREEIALAIRQDPHTVQAQMDAAVTLTERLPATVALLDTGELPYGHARALADAITPLDADTTGKIEQRVLTRAATQNRALFRASLRRAVARFDPRGVAERHDRAVQDRTVAFCAEDNAMGTVTAFLPADGQAVVRTAVQAVADRPA